MSEPSLVTVKPEEVGRVFGSRTYDKAREYVVLGRVIDVQVDASGTILGFVRGESGGPYRQTITLSRNVNGLLKVGGHCTCPVGDDCKHIAAVLIRYAQRPPKPPISPQEYAERMARSQPKPKPKPKKSKAAANAVANPAPQVTPPARPEPPAPIRPSEYPSRTPSEPPQPISPETVSNLPSEHPPVPSPETPSQPPALAELPVDPELGHWLNALATAIHPPSPKPALQAGLFYIVSIHSFASRNEAVVKVVFGREEKGVYTISGTLRTDELRRIIGSEREQPGDGDAVHALERYGSPAEYMRAHFRLSGRDGSHVIGVLVLTGRVLYIENGLHRLSAGEPRALRPEWNLTKRGTQKFKMVANCHEVLPLTPPWYIDLETRECGPLDPGVPAAIYNLLAESPEILPEQSAYVHRQISELLPDRPEFWPSPREDVEVRVVAPIPRLTISHKMWTEETYGRSRRNLASMSAPVAKVEFYYGGIRAKAGEAVIRDSRLERIVAMPRQEEFEARVWHMLQENGWRNASEVINWQAPKGFGNHLALAPNGEMRVGLTQQLLFEFIDSVVPDLRAEGWDIRIEGNPEIVREDAYEWQLGAADDGDWFDLELGIVVDGVRVPLQPMLAATIELARRKTNTGTVDELRDDAKIFHSLPNGKVLVLPVARLKPLIRTLIELFGPLATWGDKIRLPTLRSSDLAELDAAATAAGLTMRAPERLLNISRRLAQFDRIAEVPTPEGFAGELRPYQASGLAWLQFLRELEFGGVLADDMGLGKTVQTLAHICREKEQGRLDRPALIVAPTSTLPNWRHEAAKFAPSLRVLTLHGNQRSKRFGSIAEHDLILTSYPLLARDKDTLGKQEFHLAVLDEAQNIKNPTTAMAKTACAIKARHRLCLTGTPVENNLEELWSLFHFLSPGLLGPLTDFRRDFRTPIEKLADKDVQRRLSRRTKPFILRRTKEIVATELPAKTEFVERVELTDEQRDLYESVRLAMDERVRDLLATKGLDKSRIEVLDALLKLRQVCCDPRLVKLPTATNVKTSAKLERLMEMLEELFEQERSVLIFSQFTSMLDLIETELLSRNWAWVRISGETKDRDTPVKRFQNGEVRIFLISLKAGGTGLNLTAADTVIHYDPWWNPAVERQATDRAHRIGQKKSVFVYKLVAEGTVEEKILELQERKGKLAAAILDGEAELSGALTAEDLKWVLEA